jgi:hypothetical protein
MKSASLLIPRVLVTLLITIIVFSCQTPKQPAPKTDEIHLAIDPGHLPPFAKLSELVKSVRIIPLETNKQSLIGHTSAICVGKTSILISTAEMTPGIFRFSTEGKFLNKIGAMGKGPGEFTDISNLEVMPDSTTFYVQGRDMRKILEYTFDGKFIREIPFGRGMRNATILDKYRTAYTSSRDYEVRIVNSLKADTLKYINITPETQSAIPGFSGDPSMGFFYSALGRDTIWKIGPESMNPLIICDFGTGHFSSNDYIGSINRAGGYPPGKLSIGGGVLYGSGYYMFSMLREDDKKKYTYCRVVLQEKTGTSWHLEQDPQSDDVLFCSSTDFRTVAASGEWVSVVSAYELVDALPAIKASKSFQYQPELIAQIEKITNEDNPVLVLYQMK